MNAENTRPLPALPALPEAVSVLIVGAGPTGLTAGNLLGRAGIETLILERNAALPDIPRAISIDDEGLRICQAMGLLNSMLPDMLQGIEAHYLSSGRIFSKVAPTRKINGFPLFSTFYQPEFEAALYDGLQRFASVDLRFQHTVESFEQSDSGITVSVRTPDHALHSIKCTYLLACDGARSIIRHALNIAMHPAGFHLPFIRFTRHTRRQTQTYGQKWLVIDSVNDPDTTAAAQFFCDPRRPAMTILAPHQRRRWEFMLLPSEKDEQLLQHETITTLISQVGGTDQPHITRQTIYTFQSAIAARFSADRVFLLGDAAHLMPPFGGQGMNSGLRDAHNLCWKLALVLKGIADPSLLNTYQEERYSHVDEMIRFSSFLGSLIMPTSALAAHLRDALFRLLNTLPPVRTVLTEAAIKPQPRYKRGFILSDRSRAGKKLSGLMLPQPAITSESGEQVLLDELLGQGFAVVDFSDGVERNASTAHADFWQRLGTRVVHLPSAYAEKLLAGKEGAKGQRLQIVVRPDRYIFGTYTTEKTDSFVSIFQKMLKPSQGRHS